MLCDIYDVGKKMILLELAGRLRPVRVPLRFMSWVLNDTKRDVSFKRKINTQIHFFLLRVEEINFRVCEALTPQ